MSTYREVVYMCLDEIKQISDDAYFTEDHIIYLIDKYRALLLNKLYGSAVKEIPESNYQTLDFDVAYPTGVDTYKVSETAIPKLMTIVNPIIDYETSTPAAGQTAFDGEIAYVSKYRYKYVTHNSWLQNVIYASLGKDDKMYLKAGTKAYLQTVESISIYGIFESPSKTFGDDVDVLDQEFPLEENLINSVVESIVKELLGASYRPEDSTNNASDDLANLVSFIRRNAKSDLANKIEGA